MTSMFLRAYRICNPNFLDNEVSTIIDIFSDLKYPKYLINKAHMKALKTFYSTSNKTPFNEERKKIISVPFNYTFNHLDQLLKDSNFKVVFKYPNTLGRKLICNGPKNNAEAGVKITCQGCNKVYFGEIGCSFDIRLKEHKRDIRNCNVNDASFLHKINLNHNINWDEAKLLFKCNNYFARRIVESSLISFYPNYNVSKGNLKFDKAFQTAIIRSTGLLSVT